MKDQVILQMFRDKDLVAQHDVTTCTMKELLDLIKIQKGFGRHCSIKRIYDGYSAQVETGLNINDYLNGEV